CAVGGTPRLENVMPVRNTPAQGSCHGPRGRAKPYFTTAATPVVSMSGAKIGGRSEHAVREVQLGRAHVFWPRTDREPTTSSNSTRWSVIHFCDPKRRARKKATRSEASRIVCAT